MVYPDTKVQIPHFLVTESVPKAEIQGDVKIVHQFAGAIALAVHFFLFDITDIFYVRNAFGETKSPVNGSVEIIINLNAEDILIGRLAVIRNFARRLAITGIPL